MKNGIYKVAFQTPLGQGAGAVVLQDGVLRGGDSSMYYVGTYAENGDKFTAKVKADTHTIVPGMSSVFGKDSVSIDLEGTTSGDTVTTRGSSPEAPGVSFQAILSRLGD